MKRQDLIESIERRARYLKRDSKNLCEANGWQASESLVKRAAMWPAKLPDHGFEAVRVGDTMVFVRSKEATGLLKKFHRVMAVCNGCGNAVPAGRLHQHRKACPSLKGAAS